MRKNRKWEKEEKQKEITETTETTEEVKTPKARVVQLAEDLRENEKDEEILRKTFPAFESTWAEFEELLKSEDFKIYEKKYLYDLVLRTFLNKYGDTHE